VVTNNAASTQPPRELVDLFRTLAPDYENVHRGQSVASQLTTALFEDAYDTIARFINAPSRSNIVITRNATEAHNIVMYSLLTDFRPGDNVVTTMMEHNSNYVPCTDCRKSCRRGDRSNIAWRGSTPTPASSTTHIASLIDRRTKLVCCAGASNFLGTKNRLACVRELASLSGYVQPDGRAGSYLLVDGAQLVPSTFVDVRELDVDFLSFSFHKLLAPFGVGVLYGKRHLLESMRPCLYGGDMVAQGGVAEDHVEYNELPWKFAAGTPNILGTVVSAQALRLLIDLVLTPDEPRYFRWAAERRDIRDAMNRVWTTRTLTERASPRSHEYLTADLRSRSRRRTSLVAFNIDGWDPALAGPAGRASVAGGLSLRDARASLPR
jgi:cysteine desulfurase/selenocysteine lyase